MKAQIVISGLASFLNVRDNNSSMPEPSVILVRAEGHPPDPKGAHSGAHVSHNPSEKHVAFLAFDTTKVKVDKPASFKPVPSAPAHQFLALNGVEVGVVSDPPCRPKVLRSFDRVVRKDDYWPEAKNKWNRAYVPRRGRKPKKKAVRAFLRFGSGTIEAGRIADHRWKFKKKRGILMRKFAEEVVYRDFPLSGKEVVIELRDLATGKLVRRLRFSGLSPRARTVMLVIGNHPENDMDSAVRRKAPKLKVSGSPTNPIPPSVHFGFLNLVSTMRGGPIPVPIPDPVRPSSSGRGRGPGGGGVLGGPCGPGGAGGR